MRVATWNINGMRARLDFFLHWLAERGPDIVGLQELKLSDEKFPHAELAKAGYRALTHGQKSWNGVAIVSREPATLTQKGLPSQEDFGARLLSADVGGLSFTTVYCPNGKKLEHEDFSRKLVWFDALASHLESRSSADHPAILCGDFNVCPTALDTWDEERHAGDIFHTDDERARIQRLRELGWKDLFRAQPPALQAFSWWDYRGGAFHRRQGLRIDFLFATEAAASDVRSVEIDREYRKKRDGLTPSDHAPVFADLEIPG